MRVGSSGQIAFANHLTIRGWTGLGQGPGRCMAVRSELKDFEGMPRQNSIRPKIISLNG
jgi:hypothetical protein